MPFGSVLEKEKGVFLMFVDAFVLLFKLCVLEADVILFGRFGLDVRKFGTKFANMTEQALREFEDEHGVRFDKIAKVCSLFFFGVLGVAFRA